VVKSAILQQWSQEATARLTGRKIVRAEYVQARDSYEVSLEIELDDGTVLIPMRDDEGNGPGSLHGWAARTETFILPAL
jgi:hypothetical protein